MKSVFHRCMAGLFVCAIIGSLGCNAKNGIKMNVKEVVEFKILKPEEGAVLSYSSNGQEFGGTYTLNDAQGVDTKDAQGVDIFPVVKAPDKNFWPNSKIALAADGSWTGAVYIGSPENDNEEFSIFFVSAISGSDAAKNIQKTIDTKGSANLGQTLPDGTKALAQRKINLIKEK